ncbi:MAG: efflux RND transporter permease subunit [Tabrizicola sp.]|uniref:efflux RND transporter permease subunit n=1 Tax=Tabrizicola sp. TaxID=2005166 RepID=UPI002732E6B6|nr:efflux RND transporter permease subunit [Tabrizicola sp.]MDP3264546.1 efflux RND transporter permease subunit [Tabrizicola sp.]MDP3649474.1 efflux RND transporter permease subunit [Paracoccaceae bacterium]
MNFSAWAIRNPVAPLLAFFMLMVLGWQSFISLPITRFPNIDVPLVAVTVAQAGAAPAELESQVTKEIEDAVAGITGVKSVISTVTDGVSTTAVEFRMDVSTDKAVQDVKDAIDRIRGDLPGGIEAPIVSRIDIEGQAIMNFSVTAPNMTLEELSWFVDDTITRSLQGRPGIGRVDRYGGAEREIRIELDAVKLNSFGITAQAVSSQLGQTNVDLGSGRSEIGSGEQAIRTLGDQSTVEQLAATTIALPSGRFVRLTDLGEIIDTYKEVRSFSRYNGAEAVTFSVFRSKGASEVSVAETTNAALDSVRAAHPDVTITMIDDTVFYTYGNYESAIHTLLEGSILAVLVVLMFLRNWRATLITAVALPLSAVPTFYIMDLLGFSLNLVSFLAITLATGILVDDAIVEIENIARHIRMGKTPYRAAIEAADEIGLAVIATTFTIVAVFVPVSFMPGIPGQYFRQFGLTVAIAVLFSLAVARLITPMMAAYLMSARDAAGHEEKDGAFMRGYLRMVSATTKVRRLPKLGWRFPTYYMTMVVAIIVVIFSISAMLRVPGSLFPPEDVSRVSISVELPPGSSIDQTRITTDAMRDAIKDIDGVKSVLIVGGASPTGDIDVRRASMSVILDRLDNGFARKLSDLGQALPVIGWILPEAPADGRVRPQNEIEAEIFERLTVVPDVRTFKLNDRGERDISFSVLSSNEADLNLAVQKLEAALSGEPLLANVASEGALPRPEIQITPRLEEAARLGITTQQIAAVVRVATIGDFDAALAKLSIDDRLIPVRVRLADAWRKDLSRIAALQLTTATGATVPLSAVADISIAEGPAAVERLNRERIATIGAGLPVGVALDTATARFNEIVASVELPPSVRVAPAGDAEVQAELIGSFVDAMVMGLMLVLAVLILLFRSVIQPFTILLSLPLAIGGVAAALILTNNPVSMPVLIGILMLMGIVTKNAILLIDFAIEMRARGMKRVEAVIEAGHKRARPIVMTSIAMSAGMLPSALGVGEGGSFRAPMAIAVIGGIIVSTVLSLVVVPSFYLIMDDLSRLLSRVFSRMVGKKEAEPESPEAHVLAERIVRGQEELALLQGRLVALEERVSGKRQTALHVAE